MGRVWAMRQRRQYAVAGARVTDERFQKLHYDPRFAPVPQAATKVKIDQRFAKMFSVTPSPNRGRLVGRAGRTLASFPSHREDRELARRTTGLSGRPAWTSEASG